MDGKSKRKVDPVVVAVMPPAQPLSASAFSATELWVWVNSEDFLGFVCQLLVTGRRWISFLLR